MEENMISSVQPICPSKVLQEHIKQNQTFSTVEGYLVTGSDARFGAFEPLDPSLGPNNFAIKGDGGWRLFKLSKLAPDVKVCWETIPLKVIMALVNSLPEVQTLGKLQLSGKDGVFDKVEFKEVEGEKNTLQKVLISRVQDFANHYLNKFAERAHTPQDAKKTTGC